MIFIITIIITIIITVIITCCLYWSVTASPPPPTLLVCLAPELAPAPRELDILSTLALFRLVCRLDTSDLYRRTWNENIAEIIYCFDVGTRLSPEPPSRL